MPRFALFLSQPGLHGEKQATFKVQTVAGVKGSALIATALSSRGSVPSGLKRGFNCVSEGVVLAFLSTSLTLSPVLCAALVNQQGFWATHRTSLLCLLQLHTSSPCFDFCKQGSGSAKGLQLTPCRDAGRRG